jgi:cyclopropane-fatty-acyl-phospholipid synthase
MASNRCVSAFLPRHTSRLDMNNWLQKINDRLSALPTPALLQLPSGQRLGPADAPVMLELDDRRSLVDIALGRVGAVGEAIVEGRIRVQGGMRELMRVSRDLLPHSPTQGAKAGRFMGALQRWRSALAHTQQRDRAQVQFHYDLSDDFFALWLDPRRVYSCGYYPDLDMSLAQAQEAKLELICRKLRLRRGELFLDIGCGWGGLLLWAAQHHGVDATGITLSRHQHAYVHGRIEALGLSGRVRVQLCDYRDLPVRQGYDKLASVGMFEHVGRARLADYFAQLNRLLRPGGLMLNHGITAGGTDNLQLGAGMGDFIEKYIFPGGELQHVSAVLGDLARGGLEMVDTENLRPHYAKTLWAWSDALESQLDDAREILCRSLSSQQAGRTLRAYRLYLAGSALAFEQGWIALHQMLAIRPETDFDGAAMVGAHSQYPFNRQYMYQV